MRWIGYVATILWWSNVISCLSTLNRGHSYKITPKPCRVAGQITGQQVHGTCMFVWECIKSQGTHVGVCVDTFMFGSCCVHNNETYPTKLPSSSSSSPSSASAAVSAGVPSTQAQLSGAASIINSITSLTGTNHVTITTGEPSRLSDTTLNILTTLRPISIISTTTASSPSPSSSLSSSLSTSTSTSSTATAAKVTTPSTTTTPTIKTTTRQRPLGINRPKRPHVPSLHEIQSSPARLPDDGKNQMVDEIEANQGLTPNQLYSQANTVKYSTNRPIVNPVDDDQDENNIINETNQDHITSASSNSIRTEKPPWLATNPTYPKTHPGANPNLDRPNFISKPETKPMKPWTTRPTESPSTEPSIHWTLTTEPAFITKHKTTSRPTIWSSELWTTTGHRPWPNDGDRVNDEDSPANANSDRDDNDTSKPDNQDHKPDYINPLSHHQSGHHQSHSSPNHKDQHQPQQTQSQSQSPTQSQSQSQTQTQNQNQNQNQNHQQHSHYITTADKPTRRRTPQPPRIAATTASPKDQSTAQSQTAATTMSTTTIASTTRKYQGSIPTVSAVTGQAVDGRHGSQCGIPPLFPRPETRIVGGKDAPFGRWPWQVSVRRTSFFGFSSTHRCGGAVLNENWIATAGHCVDDLLTSQIRIRVGDYDFSSVQERLPYVERGIAKKVVHPKYNFFTYEYDLALVRLETSLVFAPHISPICLPATDDLLIGENATVTGWGRLSEGGTLPYVLQEVSVPIVSNDKCKSMFLRAGRHEFIPDIFLCAGYENGGQDSCQGDSGGPLQVRGKDGRYFLAGIISWGIGCAEANLPGVCTRISKFVPWILKNVT